LIAGLTLRQSNTGDSARSSYVDVDPQPDLGYIIHLPDDAEWRTVRMASEPSVADDLPLPLTPRKLEILRLMDHVACLLGPSHRSLAEHEMLRA
jgi:hypothetical protein